MLNEQEKIEKYLDNEMNPSEIRDFEQEIADNKELAHAIDLNKDLMNFFKERNPELEKTLSNLGNDYFSVEKDSSSSIANAVSDTAPQSTYSRFVPLLLLFIVLGGGGFWYLNNSVDDSISSKPPITPTETEKMIKNGMLENGADEEYLNEEIIPTLDDNNMEDAIKKDEIPKFEPKKQVIKTDDEPMAIIDKTVFNKNAVLENLITENVRSSDTQTVINFPLTNQIFIVKNEKINLKIIGQINENVPVELIVYDNKPSSFDKDYPILKTNLLLKEAEDNYKISFNANINLNKGLYYFILKKKENGDILHISKFFVK